jgi:hypothetical protein
MAAPLRRESNREWFIDRRAPERRLQVTWHPEHATAVLSIWNGDVCTSTFQLPIDEAPRLIAHLADGLSSAMSHGAFALSPTNERESWGSRLLDAIADVIARFR